MESLLTAIVPISLTRVAGRFTLAIGDLEYKQNTCEFLLTFSSLQDKNMEEYMSNLDNDHDFVRVPLSGCGRSIVLNLAEFARLRSLYDQRMFELKLEDLLQREGIAAAEPHVSSLP